MALLRRPSGTDPQATEFDQSGLSGNLSDLSTFLASSGEIPLSGITTDPVDESLPPLEIAQAPTELEPVFEPEPIPTAGLQADATTGILPGDNPLPTERQEGEIGVLDLPEGFDLEKALTTTGPPEELPEEPAPESPFDLEELLALFPQLDLPPDPGVFAGSEVQPVGQDPLSQMLTGAIASLLAGGGSPLGGLGGDVGETLRGLISRGGDFNQERADLRFERAREEIDRARRASAAGIRGELASRNLLSEPGITQGQDISALTRLEERLAPQFAGQVRDIQISELGAADRRLETSLTLATGLSESQARNFLDTIGTGTERQVALSNIALQTLDRNIEWNKFLAEFGLDRAEVMEAMRSGRIDQLLQLIALFNQFAGTARGGQVAE